MVTKDQMVKKLKTPHSIITQAKGTESDAKQTQLIKTTLIQLQLEDFLNNRQNKNKIVDKLKQIIHQWLIQIASKQGFNQASLGMAGLYVFGSFYLEVNSKQGDIDTVCIVPEQQHFYGTLYKKLSGLQEVSFILPITIVPLIKMVYEGISFDILLAVVQRNMLNNLDITNNKILISMDEKSCKSINGKRVAQYIKKLVAKNMNNFKITLKCVKLWARNKGIYSQVMGYLGGVSFTILVAKICQLYPNYPANKLLDRFFFIYSNWPWNELPVLIQEVKHDFQNLKLSQDQWKNQKSEMMLITPVFPCMNASFNISKTTIRIIKNHLNEGFTSISKIQKGKKKWLYFFKRYEFFKYYKLFLRICLLSYNQMDMTVWKGIFESKFRKLIRFLEDQFSNSLIIHPYPYSYNSKHEQYSQCLSYYIGLKIINQKQKEQIDLQHCIINFLQTLEHITPLNKFENEINIKIEVINRFDLPIDIFDNRKIPNWIQLNKQ